MPQSRLTFSMPSRPSREETLMGVAELYAARSTCSRAHVGVVISRDGRILTVGYNGAPAGMAHCDHTQDPADYGGCKQSVHAESNAIAFAARHGIAIDGAELYSTLCPCLPCAQLIINAGIGVVYIKNEYRLSDGKQLLVDAGIDIILLEGVPPREDVRLTYGV